MIASKDGQKPMGSRTKENWEAREDHPDFQKKGMFSPAIIRFVLADKGHDASN